MAIAISSHKTWISFQLCHLSYLKIYSEMFRTPGLEDPWFFVIDFEKRFRCLSTYGYIKGYTLLKLSKAQSCILAFWSFKSLHKASASSIDLWVLLTYSEFDRRRSNSYSVLSRRERHSLTYERRMRSFIVSTKNWSCWWNSLLLSSLLPPLDGLFYWAILFKNPDDSCLANYGFKIDVAWMLKGSSWSPATAVFCFWKPPLCLKDLKLYLLL